MSSLLGLIGSCPWARNKPESCRDRKNDEGKTSHRSDAQRQPSLQLETNTLIALAFLLGSATTLGTSSIYRRFFKRIKNAEWVTPNLLKRKRWIAGVVTSVGDADNFRLYHTPGFGWRGPLKFRQIPTGYRRGLQGKTIHIRVAGMDAPEVRRISPVSSIPHRVS
ncbi:hypothetical protein BJV78DRAFT_689180 [Lactifluus subvellereus]|nr:hypothetical protein BJV78DRAFT_689180 [Lactifluus subvellereus]